MSAQLTGGVDRTDETYSYRKKHRRSYAMSVCRIIDDEHGFVSPFYKDIEKNLISLYIIILLSEKTIKGMFRNGILFRINYRNLLIIFVYIA